MSDADAVRHGLAVSVADTSRLLSEPSYYRAQLSMLQKEANRYCGQIRAYSQSASKPWADEAFVHSVHGGLHEMMEYAHVLLEDAGSYVTAVPNYFSAWRREREAPFEVYKGTEQAIYGTYSGLTHTDRAPYIPIAVLRTAIELRMRGAFCVSSYVDPKRPDDLIPLDMSKLFEAIQKQQKEIEFVVDLHDVWKIYRWSNFYLHAGARDFPWVPGFLLQYLRPLFADPRTNDSPWSINGGVRMKRETWHGVRNSLLVRFEKPKFTERLSRAWRALFPGVSLLQLPAVDEKAAECVFLD